ncbi:hypothetical protein PUN4_830024 [Paraburkholderia unamae]|nr:hypothetical protein PUN4_830024 [Paraburkholderia unamae]
MQRFPTPLARAIDLRRAGVEIRIVVTSFLPRPLAQTFVLSQANAATRWTMGRTTY